MLRRKEGSINKRGSDEAEHECQGTGWVSANVRGKRAAKDAADAGDAPLKSISMTAAIPMNIPPIVEATGVNGVAVNGKTYAAERSPSTLPKGTHTRPGASLRQRI